MDRASVERLLFSRHTDGSPSKKREGNVHGHWCRGSPMCWELFMTAPVRVYHLECRFKSLGRLYRLKPVKALGGVKLKEGLGRRMK